MLNSPFMQAGATKAATRSLLKTSKFSFNGILTNLEKTVSTINQVVPLYNQVRPLISNSKTIINAFRSTTSKTKNTKKQYTQKKDFNPNVIDASINPQSHPQKKEENPNNTIFTSNDTPNKAFFI